MITVHVNNKPYTTEEETSVDQFLRLIGVNPDATALALNDMVLPKAKYATKSLKDGDKILLIKAFYGG